MSAREVSLRMGMSAQYVAQLESGRIVLTVENDYELDKELYTLINALPADKKEHIIAFIKK